MNQVDKINKEWSASEMRLLQLISGYESALTTYVLPLQGIAQTNGNFATIVREWVKITEEMKALIMKEYEPLYGKKASFEQRKYSNLSFLYANSGMQAKTNESIDTNIIKNNTASNISASSIKNINMEGDINV